MSKQRQKAEDFIGRIVGRLTILEIIRVEGEEPRFRTNCSCGVKDHMVLCRSIMQRQVLSCSCLQKEAASQVDDLTGRVFGRLTVTGRAPDRFTNTGKREIYWNCLCECGSSLPVLSRSLTYGNTLSCDCLQREINIQNLTKHGLSNNSFYTRLKRIISRCKKDLSYVEKGITVFPGWVEDRGSFVRYMEDLDPHAYDKLSKGYEVDRYPNKEGNYEPGNIRLATKMQNSNNTSTNVIIIVDGIKDTLSNHYRNSPKVVSYKSVQNRLKIGWNPEKAFYIPPHISRRKPNKWSKTPFTNEERAIYMNKENK